jgi:hypothetical protein
MAKPNPDYEVARRQLSNGFSLVAYSMPGDAQAAFRVVSDKDKNLSLTITPADAVALCAMVTTPRS